MTRANVLGIPIQSFLLWLPSRTGQVPPPTAANIFCLFVCCLFVVCLFMLYILYFLIVISSGLLILDNNDEGNSMNNEDNNDAEAATRGGVKILQNSQENTCFEVSFLINLQD